MRKITTLLLTFLLLFNLLLPAFAAEANEKRPLFEAETEPLDPKVEAMIAWALEIAEDDTHGYSQAYRYGPNYDCTSLVCTALMEGGFELKNYLSTRGMLRELPSLGFTVYRKGETEPQKGDILIETGVHAEICMGDGGCIAAHQNYDGRSGDRDGHEIEYRTPGEYTCYFCKKAQYDYILRYEPQEVKAASQAALETLIQASALWGCTADRF